MGERKNLSSVSVSGPGLLAIMLMGLIGSTVIWHQLKGSHHEKRSGIYVKKHWGNDSPWANGENYRKRWCSPCKSQEMVMHSPRYEGKSPKFKVHQKKGLSPIKRKDGGQNNGRGNGWMMEPRDCVAWCNWCLITLKRRQHIPMEKRRKHIPKDKCAQFKDQSIVIAF